MNVRVEAGTHGGRWVFENTRSYKPLRKLLAVMISSTFMKDKEQKDMVLQRSGMWFAMVDDMAQLRKVLAGEDAAKVACMEVPAELHVSMGDFDPNKEFLFGSLLVLGATPSHRTFQDSNVALLVRFHRDERLFLDC